MLSLKEIKKLPKTFHSIGENTSSQPIILEEIFNRADILTEGWLPICLSSNIKKNEVKSFSIFNQRIAIYRLDDSSLYSIDAFCPHMGTDLGNGEVKNNRLQCYFHQWKFEKDGSCSHIKNKRSAIYPIEEKYGHIWIYPNSKANFSVPHPPGMENDEVEGVTLLNLKLFVHHHVLMAGGIDLMHFKTVHKLDINFDFKTTVDQTNQNFIWELEGEIPRNTILQKFAHFLTGGKFRYLALFSGGTITSLTYGYNQRFRGTGFKLPSTSVIWAAIPQKNQVSDVKVILVLKKDKGIFGQVKKYFKILFALILQLALKDDDVKAFPNMRFQVTSPQEGDQSVQKLITLTNQLPISPWTQNK